MSTPEKQPNKDGPAETLRSGRLVRLRVWLQNLRCWKTQWAYRTITKAMKHDPYFAHTWQCNIAMPILDGAKGKLTHAEANAIADTLMKHLFEVPNT